MTVGVLALLAHGVGSRADLPVPVALFAYGAGFAVFISFVALGALWRTARLREAAAGRELPEVVQRLRRPGFVVLRGLGLFAYGVTFYAAAFGYNDATSNISSRALCVVFWVGVPILSALIGDVWAAMNPFDTLARLLRIPETTSRQPPGQWTAALFILSYVWLELCYYNACNIPRVIALWLGLYSLAAMGGAVVWGRRWLRYGEGFAGLLALIAHIGPIFRDEQSGRLRARWPGTGLARMPVLPGTVALVLVTLGSTTFDGFSRSSMWSSVVGQRYGWTLTIYNSVGLVWVVGLVTAAYLLATRVTAKTVGEPSRTAAERFIPSLVPVLLAYAIAHYFSLLVFEGQNVVAQLSDPFGNGWDLFGTAFYTVNYRAVSPRTISYVQVGAIVVGHVLGITVAHDKALEAYTKAKAIVSQYPMLAVMVLYTVGGLGLLLAA